MWPGSGLLEPAERSGLEWTKARSRYVISGKILVYGIHFQLKNQRIWGYVERNSGRLPVVGPANARFRISQARFEFLKFRQKVARG